MFLQWFLQFNQYWYCWYKLHSNGALAEMWLSMFIPQKHGAKPHSSITLVTRLQAHSSTATSISFNYAERITPEQDCSTCWDTILSCGQLYRPTLYPLNPPSPSSLSLVNDITHLSPGLGRAGGTAGLVPGAQIPWNINQKSSCRHWLRQRANLCSLLLSALSFRF